MHGSRSAGMPATGLRAARALLTPIAPTRRLLFGLLLLGAACAPADEPEWQALFNGQDLSGWTMNLTGHTP